MFTLLPSTVVNPQALSSMTDEEVVRRVLEGDTAVFELIMRRYNQRLYRIARSILRDDAEAEDVVQDAYVRAYEHLNQFAGLAKFSTWLSRIAVHEALARARRRDRIEELDAMPETNPYQPTEPVEASPERLASNAEVRTLLEDAIASLPLNYRTVFVMREVEELTTEETAETLDLTIENVKIRLHRAKAMLRRELYARAGANAAQAYPFPATRCDRLVAAVMARITAKSE